MVAMMNTEPAAIPTQASTLYSLLDLCSVAGAAATGAGWTGGNESVGVSGGSGLCGASGV